MADGATGDGGGMVVWDGARTLSVTLPGAGPGVTTYLAAGLPEGGSILVARHRSRQDAAAGETYEVRATLPDFSGRITVLRLAQGGPLPDIDIALDDSLVPGGSGQVLKVPLAQGRFVEGVNLRPSGRIGPELIQAGPFLPAEDWRARRRMVGLSMGGDGEWSLELVGEDERGPTGPSSVEVARLPKDAVDPVAIEPMADEAGAAARWRIAALGDGEALMLLGAPGARLSWSSEAGEEVAGRELVFALQDGRLIALTLDEALRASHGRSLAAFGGGGARALVPAGTEAPRPLRKVFAPHDPRVIAARAAARRSWLDRATPLSAERAAPAWSDPFVSAGWPEALIQAIRQRPGREQALLSEWALFDATAARLMAALRIAPDTMPDAGSAAAGLPKLGALADPDLRDRMRAAAALAADADARRSLQEFAEDFGRSWVPFAAALAALEQLGPAAAPMTAADHAPAVRELLKRWCEAVGEPDLPMTVGLGLDPLALARRLGELMPDAVMPSAFLAPALQGIVRQAEGVVPQAAAGDRQAVIEAGRFLLIRQAVRLADAAAGLDRAAPGTDPDEAARLRLGLLRRMRAALPDQLDAYLATATRGDMAALQKRIATSWGIGT